MTTTELRNAYMDFFVSKNHKEVPSSSLIPSEDNTVLLTTAGMQQFVPYLMGRPHLLGQRLCSVQKCYRIIDIEAIGDTRHLSFFEMLGNWSLGDYFKKEAIEMSYEFLTEVLKLPKDKLWATVFEGDENIPKDEESIQHWISVGIPRERIVELDASDNFWIAGAMGPCGPCTEMYIDRGESFGCEDPDCKPGCDCDRYLEIWNDVFMEFFKEEDGSIIKLKQHNVDTGMGLERVAALLQGKETVFETDAFFPLIQAIEQISGKSYGESEHIDRSMRIISDHIRGAVFLIADGVRPGNLDRSYILRRVIRRAINHARKLDLSSDNNWLPAVIDAIITNPQYTDRYTELLENGPMIKQSLLEEEQKFEKTVASGQKHFEEMTNTLKEGDQLSGEIVFELYATYGFPKELTLELAEEKGLSIDLEGFEAHMKKHQEISRAGAEKKFGGVGEVGEAGAPNHTATHLLHQALRDVLGDHVKQCGSDVTPERLRFDFTHPEKMTPEQIQQVEEIVNKRIEEHLDVIKKILPLEEARKLGAIGLFNEKYGDEVSVYFVGDYSREFCGGPHVKNTAEIKNFKIVKEKSSAAGVRRIKAVTNF